MRLASDPRNLRLPKLAACSKIVQNTATMSSTFCTYLLTSFWRATLRYIYCVMKLVVCRLMQVTVVINAKGSRHCWRPLSCELSISYIVDDLDGVQQLFENIKLHCQLKMFSILALHISVASLSSLLLWLSLVADTMHLTNVCIIISSN